MRDEHIIDILESAPFAALSAAEMERIREHTRACADCERAYEAARLASVLIGERAAATFEPPPFFQTRVMAAWRERQAASQQWTFSRVWKATGALVASMAASVVLLASVTFFAPANTLQTDTAFVSYPYSTDEAIIAQDLQFEDEMTYGDVLTTIYESTEEAAR
ncbi:MAG TPA: hypothetical protein VGV59_00310 [Pyrinomonadaceae bacterium]|nr:hypothetical protein [Pyrinomonadaceae bacterium]